MAADDDSHVESMFLICSALGRSMIEKDMAASFNIGVRYAGSRLSSLAHYWPLKGGGWPNTRASANELARTAILSTALLPADRTPPTEKIPPQIFDAIHDGQSIKTSFRAGGLGRAMSFLTSERLAFMTRSEPMVVNGGQLSHLNPLNNQEMIGLGLKADLGMAARVWQAERDQALLFEQVVAYIQETLRRGSASLHAVSLRVLEPGSSNCCMLRRTQT